MASIDKLPPSDTFGSVVEADRSIDNAGTFSAEFDANKPIKVTLPGPMTTADTLADEYFNDRKTLATESLRTNAALVVGLHAAEAGKDRLRQYNSAAFVRPDVGLSGRYDKLHRVPFGEYIPLRESLPWLMNLTPYRGSDGLDKGEQAAMECEVYNLDPRLVMILGRLYFRTSYGQNVLQHSTEMAHISGMLAQELGGDVAIAKAGALLHDIGKAVDHEVQGTHVEIGRRILAKFNVDNRIIQAMQSHHEEYPYETLESIIVQTADAISGGRPGARREVRSD